MAQCTRRLGWSWSPVVLLLVLVSLDTSNPSRGAVVAAQACTSAPGAPTNLAGTVAGTAVSLSWNASSGACAPDSYALRAGSAPGLTNLVTVNVGLSTALSAQAAPNFIETFIDNPTAAGRTSVAAEGTTLGVFDNVYYRNSNEPARRYQGLQFQGTYRPAARWTVAGHWTVQLGNNGNFEGEAGGQPGTGSSLGDYPEILVASRNFPEGRLDDFQRHKVRVWTIYNMDLGRFGSLDVAPLWRYNSALTYSLTAAGVPLSAMQRAQNPGYARLPGSGTNGSQTLFFGDRGSQEFAGYGLVDLGLTYQVPLWRALRPWVEVEVLNVLGNDKLIAWDTSITADPSSALDANGLPRGYLQGARFGQATSTAHYPRPRPGLTGGRTYLAALGIRF